MSRQVIAWLLASVATAALAGPVDVYLTGPQFCPHDRPAGAARIDQGEAIARTRTLLPKSFCGPTAFVSGCTYDVENEYDSWRVYVHQYADRGGRKDQSGLAHTYLILDATGNCLAHIPGTVFGALN